jgi:uncharacterized protein YdhG (YjbR/CyaY superfamily)
MRAHPPKNVEEYLHDFPELQRKTLEKVRKAIRSAAPKAVESISYGIAGYKLNGPLVYLAGFKNHCSFFPASHAVMNVFEEELRPYEISKGTIHFPIGKPLPSSLVKKIVAARIKENETKLQLKAKKKAMARKGANAVH